MDPILVRGFALAVVLVLLAISAAFFLEKGWHSENAPFGVALVFVIVGTVVMLALGLFEVGL